LKDAAQVWSEPPVVSACREPPAAPSAGVCDGMQAFAPGTLTERPERRRYVTANSVRKTTPPAATPFDRLQMIVALDGQRTLLPSGPMLTRSVGRIAGSRPSGVRGNHPAKRQ